MTEQLKIEAHFNDKTRNTVEIVVPHGLSHKDLNKVNLGELLAKFRPSGCGACLSGQHFIIREKFEKVLPVDIHALQLNKVVNH